MGEKVRVEVTYPETSIVFEYDREEWESATAADETDLLMDVNISNFEHDEPTIRVLPEED